MSLIEEGYVVAPWVGPTSSKNVFSVVVLGSNVDVIEKLATAVTETHSRGAFRWKLIVLRSFSLEEVVRQTNRTGRIAIDFVVVSLDARSVYADKSGYSWVKTTIAQIHPDLRSRRVVLVNTCYNQKSEFSVPQQDLLSVQSEFGLDMLHTNVNDSSDVSCLARRLLRYMEVSFGTKTGLPNLNL